MARTKLAALIFWAALGDAGAAHRVPPSEVVGKIRVQALTPTLLRVEPMGPKGWEDRRTFTVASRDFDGLVLERSLQKDNSTKLECKNYTVVIFADTSGFLVFDSHGRTVYNSVTDNNPTKNLLHWPSPWTLPAYALVDSPRFFVPDWEISPCCPPGVQVDDSLRNTNGYDFGNDVDGDTYIFLMGEGLEGYAAARRDFLRLTGPVPLLPDWAYGTWFTWWHYYNEGSAKAEVTRWDTDSVPLDVWGLDMNWRLTADHQDREYNHPNTSAFPDMAEWFGWLKGRGVHTYFNDHPFGTGPQTSPGEVGFRWDGLTQWLQKGLSFWWFDHNWKFSIGPPNAPNPTVTGATSVSSWKGLTTTAWGSHVYYSITNRFNKYMRPDDEFAGGRPISLSMTTPHNEISGYSVKSPLHTGSQAPGIDSRSVAESPSHHRYPVWWNGDFTTMNNDLEMMVDAGVHDFKPFVHPDCGGDGWFRSAGEVVRRAQMCAFGTILRFHGGQHPPWIYGEWWEGHIRKYVELRYKMLPMIIAAGQRVTATGFPMVARCDLYWPEHAPHSRSNHQYLFLDDILVAPIFDAKSNWTNRQVWIPPGDWLNVWNGLVDSGPKEITGGQTWERQPMWIRMDGGLLITTDKPGLRVANGDWSTLVVDAYACLGICSTTRTIFERSTKPHPPNTTLTLSTDGSDAVRIELGRSSDGTPRAWVVRLNLRLGQEAVHVTIDGQNAHFSHIYPKENDDGSSWAAYFPLGGARSHPPSSAGPVAEIDVPSGSAARVVEIVVAKTLSTCAWDLEDCSGSGCCKQLGSQCFEKNAYWSTCMPSCETGSSVPSIDGEPWTCNVKGGRPNMYELRKENSVRFAGTSLFCFTVTMPRVPFQQRLTTQQREHGYGIWGCDTAMVVSAGAEVDSMQELKVIPKDFVNIWDEIRQDGRYLHHDWTVKVDVDAVFFPPRLVQHLGMLRPPWNASLYIKTSPTEGFAGPLKVLSLRAVKEYFKHEKTCRKKIGHVSEDFYLMTCLDAIGVSHLTDEDAVKDFSRMEGWLGENHQSCVGEAWAAVIYPYHQVKDWLKCARTSRIDAAAIRRKLLIGKDEDFSMKGVINRHAPLGIGLALGGILAVAAVAFFRNMRIHSGKVCCRDSHGRSRHDSRGGFFRVARGMAPQYVVPIHAASDEQATLTAQEGYQSD